MRDFSILKERILKYLDFKGVSKYEFYQKTGVSNGVLSQKNGLSEDNILKFLSYYRDINPNWFLYEIGDIIIENTIDMVNEPREVYGKEDPYLVDIQKKYIQKLEAEIELLKEEKKQNKQYDGSI